MTEPSSSSSTSLQKPPSSKKSKTISRKWSSLKQYHATSSPSQHSLATHPLGNKFVDTSFSSIQSQLTANGDNNLKSKNSKNSNNSNMSINKKPKWEVIEHYKGSNRGRDTISSSLLAVSIFLSSSFFLLIVGTALFVLEYLYSFFYFPDGAILIF
jgi:hypothetical protein